MSAIHLCMNRLTGAKLATVVHVNPAEADIATRYLELGAQRVVLVCGDPDVALALRRTVQDRPAVEVVETAAAPTSGTAQWLRFNVREVDGLLQPSGLRTFYPRLQLLERVPVPAATLNALIERLKLGVQDGRQNVLVLETPGLDAQLLEGLAEGTLRAFDAILTRGAREGLYEGGAVFGTALQWLDAHHYRAVLTDEEKDPLWPCTLLQYDAAAAERAALGWRVKELEAQLVAQAAEHRARLEQLAKTRDEQAKLAADREVQQQAMTQAKAQAEKLAQDRSTVIDQLTKARDEQARLAGDREVQLQAMTQAKAQAEKLAQDRHALIDQLTKARDEQAKLSAERQKRVGQLDAEIVDLSARYGLLQEELVKAEAHVELISDLVLRETLR